MAELTSLTDCGRSIFSTARPSLELNCSKEEAKKRERKPCFFWF